MVAPASNAEGAAVLGRVKPGMTIVNPRGHLARARPVLRAAAVSHPKAGATPPETVL